MKYNKEEIQMKIQIQQIYEQYVVNNINKIEEFCRMKYEQVLYDNYIHGKDPSIIGNRIWC